MSHACYFDSKQKPQSEHFIKYNRISITITLCILFKMFILCRWKQTSTWPSLDKQVALHQNGEKPACHGNHHITCWLLVPHPFHPAAGPLFPVGILAGSEPSDIDEPEGEPKRTTRRDKYILTRKGDGLNTRPILQSFKTPAKGFRWDLRLA